MKPLETFEINHFKKAIQRYEKNKFYVILERVNSMIVVSLQLTTLIHLLANYEKNQCHFLWFFFLIAYLITDFINGLVHMYMDNNTHYTSCVGPLISVFHLHHAKIRYKNRHPLQVYFYESGTKFWLAVYLFLLFIIQHTFHLSYLINFTMVCIGILSSFAELSHYWCHNSKPKDTLITRLQSYRILLSKKHHYSHHSEDNKHYAFLNGVTDPLLNKIANYVYDGYKNHADKHVQAYMKEQQINKR